MNIRRLHPGRQNEDGLMTLVFIVLLAIMMTLVTAESSSLYRLNRQVKFLEQQQIKRFNASSTNSLTGAISQTK